MTSEISSGKNFTTGEFARRANVSVRTIRYYDKEGLLKPSFISDAGYRLYTENDFAKLQKILTLKYLGFSLDEIRNLTLKDRSSDYVADSLKMQLRLVQSQIESLELVRESLEEAIRSNEAETGENPRPADWNRMLQLIHMVNMEKTLAQQYRSSENVDIRIRLHRDYSTNPESWFSWIFRNMDIKPGMTVLELGCGNGELWRVNRDRLPAQTKVILSDYSAGMVADAGRNLPETEHFVFRVLDCCNGLPFEDHSLDMVVANHLLFYIKDRNALYREIGRVLKPGGTFICSTYGRNHMRQMTELVQKFDARINLSSVALWEVFGLEQGAQELEPFFVGVERRDYEDSLKVDAVAPLVDYILSCHGNQNEYLNQRLPEFEKFVEDRLKKEKAITITKEAGIFICRT